MRIMNDIQTAQLEQSKFSCGTTDDGGERTDSKQQLFGSWEYGLYKCQYMEPRSKDVDDIHTDESESQNKRTSLNLCAW